MTVGDCGELPLADDLPNGATVEIVASARDLGRRALSVFGWPLGAAAAASAAAEWFGTGDATIIAALLGIPLAVVGFRIAFAPFDEASARRSATPNEAIRVVLRDGAWHGAERTDSRAVN